MNRSTTQVRTAHVDTFCRDHLPPAELMPKIVLDDLGLPETLNCAVELLDKAVAEGDGDRPALLCDGRPWSYRELLERANQIAHVLVEDLGLHPGNRVLLRGPNNPVFAACWFGILKAGGVAVSTMPLLRTRELEQIVTCAEVDIAITDARIADDCQHAMGRRRQARVLTYGDGATDSLEALLATKPISFENCRTAADDVAIIAFTSGTTGKSKGTLHFHRDIMAICECFPKHVLRATKDDIFCGTPPLAFTYALGGLLLFPLSIRAAALLIEQPSPPNLLQAIQQHRPTVCFTSPTGYRAMLAQLGRFDISSLRKCVSAGEHLPAATFLAWEKATEIRIIDGIGSTELLHIFISSPPEEARPGSTGKVIPGYQAKIVDDDGNDLPANEVGRLAVCGPTGCKYLNNPEQQQQYVQNGWNLTGDSYSMDADGYFWYQARTDDMIISSGYNISGPEVENALLEHPAVAECAVVGVPDEARGQVVKAYVVLKPGVEGTVPLVKELQDFVKKIIAPYKYPRALEFLTALPRTQTGKLQRYRLRDPGANMKQTSLQPEGWKPAIGYAQSISAHGHILMLAGQIGWDPTTCELTSDDFAEQTAQALRNIVAILHCANAEPRHITRLTWYVTERDEYIAARTKIGEHYREIMGRHFPAMSVVIVAGLLEPKAKVEIEATAVIPE
jgi:2-aminobenzoate-CoA ligase